MSTIPSLITFTPGLTIVDSEIESNFASIRDTVNTYCLFTDVNRTVTATLTFSTSLLFGATADVGSAAARPRHGYFSGILAVGTTVQTGASNGDFVLGHASILRAVNFVGSGMVRLLELDPNDNSLHIYHQSGFGAITMGLGVGVGDPISSLGANDGDVLFRNNRALRGVNVAANGSVRMVETDINDRVVIAGGGAEIKIGRALIALGGGSAPTLGTIGGSGPAAAAQNTWMKFFDSAGVACFVPVWK